MLTHQEEFANKKDQLEYIYRLGRVTHALKRYEEAIRFYEQTISEGRYEVWYYACRAALEKGKILENQGEKDKAIKAYKECLSIQPEEHKTGLHQAAKAGLSRVQK